jgi:ribosomal-protein-alanine N-acetyltransferase
MLSFFTPKTYIIDFTKPDDASAIAVIHGKNFAHGWSKDDIHAMLTSKSYLCLVVRPSKGGAAIGFLIIRVTLDEAEILTIAIDKPLQNKGFGRQLIEKAMPFLQQRGVKKLFLEVASDNFPAITLYKAQSFVKIATRKNYYNVNGKTKDAIVMQREF